MRTNLDILEDKRIFNNALTADRTIQTAAAVNTALSYCEQVILKCSVVTVFCPEICIRRNHAVEGQHTACIKALM